MDDDTLIRFARGFSFMGLGVMAFVLVRDSVRRIVEDETQGLRNGLTYRFEDLEQKMQAHHDSLFDRFNSLVK